MTVLEHAGATVAATGPGTLTISGLAAGRVVALLGEHAVPFSEVSAHRATLEEAYMELTRDAVEYRAEPAGSFAGTGAAAAEADAGRPGDDHHAPRHRTARPPGPSAAASATCCTPSGPSSAPCAAG